MLAPHLHRPPSTMARVAQASAGPARCSISSALAPLLLSRPRRCRQAHAVGDDDAAAGPSSSSSSGDDELARLLKADMERFSSSAAAAAAASSSPQNRLQQQQRQEQQQNQQLQPGKQQQEEEGGVKAALDRVLIADFFAVLAALAWLGAGLAEEAAFGSSRLVDAWMPLWPLLWQPLIGVLMAGALVSGGAGWLASKQQEQAQGKQEQQRRR